MYQPKRRGYRGRTRISSRYGRRSTGSRYRNRGTYRSRGRSVSFRRSYNVRGYRR